jgi:hypothetical protein
MSHHEDGSSGDPRARLAHLLEAIQHLRAAGLNEPAENLEKMAHEMHEHLEREQREKTDGKSPGKPENAMREHRDGDHRDSRRPDSWRPSFARPMWGGGPPMIFGRMEEMQKEIRSLSSQVQELRNMMKGRGGDQQPSTRKPDAPREGDHRDGNAGGPPRAEQHPRDGEGHRDGDRDDVSRNKQPDQPRNQPSHDDAKRDGPPRDSAVRNAPTPPQDAPPRGNAKRDGEHKDGARAESSSGVGRPSELDRARFSELDRARFMALSDRAREKFVQGMRESRDKMINSTAEERMKAAKELFDRVEAEDKAKGNESRAADDGLRALEVKPPL